MICLFGLRLFLWLAYASESAPTATRSGLEFCLWARRSGSFTKTTSILHGYMTMQCFCSWVENCSVTACMQASWPIA